MFKRKHKISKSIFSVVLILSLLLQTWTPIIAGESSSSSSGSLVSQGISQFKSGFDGVLSPSWLLTKFGIQTGYHLLDCAMEKKTPSIKAIAKSMITADYIASTAGGTLGYATGCFFTPLLSRVPVVGGLLSNFVPILTAYIGGSAASNSLEAFKNGKLSLKEIMSGFDWPALIAGSIGWTAGSLLCGAILPPIGGIVGSMLGDYFATKLVNWFRSKNGSSKEDSPAMPTGNTAGPVAAPTSDGNGKVVSEISTWGNSLISKTQYLNEIIPTEVMPPADNGNEVQKLQEKYQSLYQAYNQNMTEGNNQEATQISTEMKSIQSQIKLLTK